LGIHSRSMVHGEMGWVDYESTLTAQEIQAAYLAHYDLGPGYPQLVVGRDVARLYTDDGIEELSLKFSPEWTPDRQRALDSGLQESLQRFLGLTPGSFAAVHCTFSGSVALDRVLAAAISVVGQERRQRISVVTTSPCIDIMRLFLEERRYVDLEFVDSRSADPWGLDVDGIVDRVRRETVRQPAVVLLTSPENPTGQCWSADDLLAVAVACSEAGAVLVVDHAFLTAGVHVPGMVTTVWEAARGACDWLAVWDTGKTFGLNEDKLGFIISGSEKLAAAVTRALDIMQFGVARRQKLIFAELFRMATNSDHVGTLRAACQVNLKAMRDRTDGIPVEVIEPIAGSLAILRIPAGHSDEATRRHLLSRGVGVVAGSVFFHGDWVRSDLLRIALARDPVHFGKGIDRLVSELGVLYAWLRDRSLDPVQAAGDDQDVAHDRDHLHSHAGLDEQRHRWRERRGSRRHQAQRVDDTREDDEDEYRDTEAKVRWQPEGSDLVGEVGFHRRDAADLVSQALHGHRVWPVGPQPDGGLGGRERVGFGR
jgi:histidinol-phosphate/aromatic aminotransferase/cobyric acid decarboxylase-like protein